MLVCPGFEAKRFFHFFRLMAPGSFKEQKKESFRGMNQTTGIGEGHTPGILSHTKKKVLAASHDFPPALYSFFPPDANYSLCNNYRPLCNFHGI